MEATICAVSFSIASEAAAAVAVAVGARRGRTLAVGRLGDHPELSWGHGRHGAGGDGHGGTAQNPEMQPSMTINTYKKQKNDY